MKKFLKLLLKARHLFGGYLLLDYGLAKGINIHIGWYVLVLFLFEVFQLLWFAITHEGSFIHNVQLYFVVKKKFKDTFADIFFGFLGIIIRGSFGY